MNITAIELPYTVLQGTVLGAAPTTDDTVIGTPLQQNSAAGADNLDTPQRGAIIGEPIPIVFCRRVNNVGGVLVSPPATEARFEDDASSNITASYHLVLSEGEIDSIQVRDVFQRACRVGTFTQTYDKRAGTFLPGNFIDNTPNLEAPYYCGTGGTYSGLSTMTFTVTIPAGFDQWNRQVHCFIRGGVHVTRLLDSVTGPSNNVADLLRYLLRKSSRVPEEQINTASLLTAATFTNTNGFWFNGTISESTNLRDWISEHLKYFLLRQSRNGGKEGLRPLLPVNNDGTIKTTPVSWEFTFTENHIIPGGFEITYTPLADRKPVCINVLWRQQDDFGIAVIRTSSVRYPDTAIDGPFEQHDLSGFCASEDHAVKVGTYILSKRRHVTHRLVINVKPDSFNPTLTAGNLVRVRLQRIASTGADSVHDYLYEVERIGKSVTGEVQLELTHFPVDANLSSVVAQEVASAVGAGYVVPTGLSGVTCDVNADDDVTVPGDTSLDPGDWDLPPDGSFDVGVTPVNPADNIPAEDENGDSTDSTIDGGGGGGGGGKPGADEYSEEGAEDDLGSQDSSGGGVAEQVLGTTGDPDYPINGDVITAPPICAGGQVIFYRNDPTAPGGRVQISTGEESTYTLTINDVDYSVYSETVCPEPTSPTGYGEPIQSSPIGPIRLEPDFVYMRWAGTVYGRQAGIFGGTGTMQLDTGWITTTKGSGKKIGWVTPWNAADSRTVGQRCPFTSLTWKFNIFDADGTIANQILSVTGQWTTTTCTFSPEDMGVYVSGVFLFSDDPAFDKEIALAWEGKPSEFFDNTFNPPD